MDRRRRHRNDESSFHGGSLTLFCVGRHSLRASSDDGNACSSPQKRRYDSYIAEAYDAEYSHQRDGGAPSSFARNATRRTDGSLLFTALAECSGMDPSQGTCHVVLILSLYIYKAPTI